MPVYARDRDIVVPGEPLASQPFKGEGAVYVDKRKIYAKALSIVEIDSESKVIRAIPLKKKYLPAKGDKVIGKIVDVGVTHWTVDINSPYPAILQATEVLPRPTDAARMDLSKILKPGDIVVAKVIVFDLTRDPLLTIKERGLGKITKGTLVQIDPAKIPRLIGKKGSMANMIRKTLGVDLIVGKNGRVIIISDDREREALAILIIRKIEREAHVSGLTDRIKKFLESYGIEVESNAQ